MKDIAEIFIPLIWLFGSLCFWPVFRFWLKIQSKGVRWLKYQFWFQVVSLVIGFSMVQYTYMTGNKDWLHSLIIPYFFGAISWVIALLILFMMGISSRSEKSSY